MKGIIRLVAAVLGLGTLLFLDGCAEESGWNTGFQGMPLNSAATPDDSN
jgi:hypothetical protein